MNTSRESLLQLLYEKGEPPPLPDILAKMEQKVNDPDCDFYEISGLIQTDSVLSGKLIRLANSALFGSGREKAEEMDKAVRRLGIKMIMDLIYTLELPGLFQKPKSFNQTQFWRHSLGVAYLTRALARKVPVKTEEVESSYLAGLMHDLGIIVFDHLIPEEYEKFLCSLEDAILPLEVLEKEQFGIDHAELGAEFLEKWWPVSEPVIQAVRNYHIHSSRLEGPLILAHLVAASNSLAHKNGMGNGILPAPEEGLKNNLLEKTGLNPEELEDMLDKTREGVEAAESLMEN